MKIVARVTPEARARMRAALDKALDEFDASKAPQPARRKTSVDSRLFAFAYELDEWDWERKPVYDPHDWNSAENIKPPKMGEYCVRFRRYHNSDEWTVIDAAFWNGEHWQESAMGEVRNFPPESYAQYTSVDRFSQEG